MAGTCRKGRHERELRGSRYRQTPDTPIFPTINMEQVRWGRGPDCARHAAGVKAFVTKPNPLPSSVLTQTYIMIKPDGVQRGLIGNIITVSVCC